METSFLCSEMFNSVNILSFFFDKSRIGFIPGMAYLEYMVYLTCILSTSCSTQICDFPMNSFNQISFHLKSFIEVVNDRFQKIIFSNCQQVFLVISLHFVYLKYSIYFCLNFYITLLPSEIPAYAPEYYSLSLLWRMLSII